MDANFKLDDLLKLELHKFADEVGEIVDCAQKEEKMEQGLAKLKVIDCCSTRHKIIWCVLQVIQLAQTFERWCLQHSTHLTRFLKMLPVVQPHVCVSVTDHACAGHMESC